MPTIERFRTCKISVYADHAPPHFHIEDSDIDALVNIETLMVVEGDVRRAGEAMEWAVENQGLLLTEWRKLNAPRRDRA